MTADNPHQSPHENESPAELCESLGSRNNWKDYSPEYNAAFKTALLLQAVLAVLTALILDFGQTHHAFWVAFLCQWALIWIILFRRPVHPTRFDLALVQYSIVPLLFLIACAGPWFLRLLGVQP